MIKEIAVEPELIIELSKNTNRAWRKLIGSKFGVNTGVLKSRYPENWNGAFRRAFEKSSLKDLEKKAAEELFSLITEFQIKRTDTSWVGGNSWLKNSLYEHERKPFKAIACKKDIYQTGKNIIVDFDDVRNGDADNIDLLNNNYKARVSRSNSDLTDILADSFYHAKKFIIIDAFFDPFKRDYTVPLLELITGLSEKKKPEHFPEILIIKREGDGRKVEDPLRRVVLPKLPEALKLKFLVYDEKPRKEEFHNRYILSDIGGIVIDPGFARNMDSGSTDNYDVNLMNASQYLDIMRIYIDDPDLNFTVTEEYILENNVLNRVR